MNPSILLQSGNYFDYLNPETSLFTLRDITHGLSRECRFSGQTKKFYSVAQHSVAVSHVVPEHMALHGLLHDAHEAFMKDIPSPLKWLLPEYKALEDRVELAVLGKFGITQHKPAEVKEADLVLLATERRDLMPQDQEVWTMLEGVTPLTDPLIAVDPPIAESMFIKRLEAILGRHVDMDRIVLAKGYT